MGEPVIGLGVFDLETCVGRGGMGQVWRGTHRSSRTTVAVKILDAETALRPGFSEAFHDEARVVAGLQHPHIVTVHELGIVPERVARESGGRLVADSPYLVMEYAHGGTLEEAIGRLTWRDIEPVLLRVLQALSHAHARGVIHLDVKPANLLLGCGPMESWIDGVRLTDFGLAWQDRAPGRAERRAELGGTLGRMAPEQIQATWREYGPWTDLYAVGAMVWQYATGAKPFSGTTRAAMLVGPLTRELPPFDPIRPVPDELEGWLRAMMARDPAGRFMLAADAARALQALQAPTSGTPLRVLLGDSGWDPDAPTTLLTGGDPAIELDTDEEETIPQRLSRWSQVPMMPATWRLPQPEQQPSPSPGAVGLGLFGLRAVPFIGREAERDALWDRLKAVRSRLQAEVILLRGAAGVGKSRLAEWIGQRAHAVGAVSAFLRVEHTADSADPHAGLRPALARHLGCVELSLPAAEKHLRRVLAWWGAVEPWLAASLARWLLPDAPPPAELPEVLLAALLRAMTRHRPVVLWLDDVQWGLESLDALQHLMAAQAAEPLPLLVLMTATEEALVEHPEAGALLDRLSPQVMPIGPLEPPEDELLVRALTGLTPALAAQLAEHCQGNPLLAVHIISDWIARGTLTPSAEGFRLDNRADSSPLHRARLPDQMRDLWRRRLWRLTDQITGPAMEALELAAVMGAEVQTTEWQALLGDWRPEPLADALLRARLARPTARGWAFIHGMLREVLIEQARRAGRWAKHHQACAGLLASAQTPALQERLGQHLLYAGRADEALTHLMDAARTLDQRGISRAASRVITRAEEALDRMGVADDDRRRASCRMLMAQIEIRRHHPGRWVDELEALRDRARAKGWTELEAEALWVLGEAYQKSDRLDDALESLEASRALATRQGLHRIQQEVLVAMALLKLRRGDQAGAAPLMRSVLAQPPHPDAPTVRLVARLNLASISRITGKLDDARRYAQEAIDVGQRQGCLDVVAHGQLILGAISERQGDLTAAEAHLNESLRIVRRTSKFRAIALTLNSLGEIARRQGRLDEAEAAYRSSLAWGAASGRPIEAPQINLALVLIRRQRFAEARELLEQMLERLVALGDRFTSWHCRAFLLSALAGQSAWTAFDAQLAAVLDDPDGHRRINEDVAEEAELAGQLALRAGHRSRALAAWRLARAHWLGLKRRHRIEDISRRIAELEA